MTQLYVLAQEYRAAAEKLADLDLDAATVADTLDSISGELDQKLVAVAMIARNHEAAADARDAVIKDMQAHSKRDLKTAAYLESYAIGAMLATGRLKIRCPHFTLSVKENPPAVEVFDAAKVPAEFMAPPPPAPPPMPDKTAIKAAIKAGRDVGGCRITQGQRLEVKA
jgi:hypothetical protein